MIMKGASIVINCLLEQGVDTVFGYPGVSILEVYDELYKNKNSIRHVLSAHEQGAAHAADGYARSTGRVGVCLATSGPGATNLVTGIAAAFMDSSPVVFITCNVDEKLLGRDAFQEVDIVGISMPITKCSYLIDSPEEIAETMREAFAIAGGGRPGPVLIDITHNATAAKADYEFIPKAEHIKRGRLSRMHRRGDMGLRREEFREDDINILAEMIAATRKPLILAGGGVVRSGASGALERFAESRAIPVISTLMGSGVMHDTNPLYLGMAGSYGCPQANYALQSCDMLIAVGVRFSDRLTGKTEYFAPEAKIVHIDIDRSEIDKNVDTAHHVVGDAGEILESLDAICPRPDIEASWTEELRRRMALQAVAVSFPEALIRAINRLCPDALIATDVGQHQIWTCRNFDFSYPGQLITSGGYGAMGFGLGAAIGAKAGNPEKTVIHITGDGSFGMNMTELATEVREKLPVITVIFNNSALGLVRQNQRFNYGRRYSQTSLGDMVDYKALAAAFGIDAFHVEDLPQFEAALGNLLRSGKGGVIDCLIDKDEYIRPMLDKGRLTY
ncbi:MAG: biosynthetic-type acetolactate synthase large subunit [Clostridiales bacterium]|nr:biosynthetic-type acetolactate synthase large subunit [Clostridiales bacterium]